jgi:hypothetical protein
MTLFINRFNKFHYREVSVEVLFQSLFLGDLVNDLFLLMALPLYL